MPLAVCLDGIQSFSSSGNKLVPFQQKQQDELCINSTNDKIPVEVASSDGINSPSIDQQQNGNTGGKNNRLLLFHFINFLKVKYLFSFVQRPEVPLSFQAPSFSPSHYPSDSPQNGLGNESNRQFTNVLYMFNLEQD